MFTEVCQQLFKRLVHQQSLLELAEHWRRDNYLGGVVDTLKKLANHVKATQLWLDTQITAMRKSGELPSVSTNAPKQVIGGGPEITRKINDFPT